MTRFPARVPLALVAALLLLGACGSPSTLAGTDAPPATSSPTSVASATPTASATDTAPSYPACQVAQLTATLASHGVALGYIANRVWLVNTSNAPCDLSGYATVRLLDGQRMALPTNQQQVTQAYTFSNLQVQRVALAAHGGRAGFIIEWLDNPTPGQSCPTAVYLGITPPGASVSLTVSGPVAPCGGTVITSPLVAPSVLE